MPEIIEYCHSSADDRLCAALESLDVEVSGRRCLEQCGICRREQFLVVDGELKRGPSFDGTVETKPSEESR